MLCCAVSPDIEKRGSGGVDRKRSIRSFVSRRGRLTEGQRRAIEQLWPRFGVAAGDARLDLAIVFGRQRPRVLEIGFGNGESLAMMAAADPQTDFLGIEVHEPGIGHLLLRVEQLGLENLRVMRGDAIDLLKTRIPEHSLDRIQIFFPDPWPKRRHHKRRLVRPDTAELLVSKLKDGGRLHVATDWHPYARQMLQTLNGTLGICNVATDGGSVVRPDYRPLTKFERRGLALGHKVCDMVFERRR